MEMKALENMDKNKRVNNNTQYFLLCLLISEQVRIPGTITFHNNYPDMVPTHGL